MDLETKYIILQDLFDCADVKHFTAKEVGRLLRASWTGPERALPDNLYQILPVIVLWDLIRDELGSRIRLSSTYRPPEYNTQSGQSDTSYHLDGAAADGVALDTSYEALEKAVERVVNRKSTRDTIAARCGLGADTVRIGWGAYPEKHNRFVHGDVTSTSWSIWAKKRTKRVTKFR